MGKIYEGKILVLGVKIHIIEEYELFWENNWNLLLHVV